MAKSACQPTLSGCSSCPWQLGYNASHRGQDGYTWKRYLRGYETRGSSKQLHSDLSSWLPWGVRGRPGEDNSREPLQNPTEGLREGWREGGLGGQSTADPLPQARHRALGS